MGNPLSDKELKLIDAYWRAANYLSVGQIYLHDNPLLKKPLTQGTCEAEAAGSLGHHPGPEFHLCPSESSDQDTTTST